MNDEEIREMIVGILEVADYDLSKFFDPEISEDPEEAGILMNELIEIAKQYIHGT